MLQSKNNACAARSVVALAPIIGVVPPLLLSVVPNEFVVESKGKALLFLAWNISNGRFLLTERGSGGAAYSIVLVVTRNDNMLRIMQN
jgi:hypothetical protein